MMDKILTLIFIMALTSGFGQDLDSTVVIRDYFTKHQAKQRHTTRYNSTDSIVHLGPMAETKWFTAHKKKLLFVTIRKEYRINSILVSKEVFVNERIEFEKATWVKYIRKEYYKDGTPRILGIFIQDMCIDTCYGYYPNGRIKSMEINDCEVTAIYYEDTGIPIIKHKKRKWDFYNDEGNLDKILIDDYENGRRTTETYSNGVLMNTENEKISKPRSAGKVKKRR
jgi:hypothetical protein